MIPATSSLKTTFKSSILTVPSGFEATSKTSIPATLTLAGLVPWALSE